MWTLAHSPTALDALLQWYPLHDEVAPVLGERRTWLFCYAISTASDCLICSTFFRRLLIDSGEDPASLELDAFDELIIDFGRRLGTDPHSVDDALHAQLAERLDTKQIVTLTAFGAIMVALDIGKPLEIALYPMGSTGELDSLRVEVKALGRDCVTALADVRDDEAVSAAVAHAIEHFGRIDVLFNNAGICAYGLAHELTEPEWDAMLDINLKGAWIVARRVIPHMIEARRGVIV